MFKLLLLAAALAGALAGEIPFSSCGSSSDKGTVKTVEVDGNLTPGNTIGITASGTLSEQVTDGNYDITVAVFGIPVIDEKGKFARHTLYAPN